MDKTDLENSIISTIAYYDVLGGYPLSIVEIYKYLTSFEASLYFNDNKAPFSLTEVDINELINILNTSKRLKSLIDRQKGFYYLKSNNNAIQKRIEHQKISAKKWKKAQRIVKWFQIVPYVRMVAISGSLAIENCQEQSDIDLLIVAKYGRIWTVRALLGLLTQIIGQRRYKEHIKDKICLNWFITEKSLELGLKNLSRAHFCTHVIPLYGKDYFNRFINANQWINAYLPLCSYFQGKKTNQRTAEKSRFLIFIAKALEIVLNTKIGDSLENILKKWQKAKIIQNVAEENISFNLEQIKDNKHAHLCLSDTALLFHYPVSRNIELQNGYYAKIKELIKLQKCG